MSPGMLIPGVQSMRGRRLPAWPRSFASGPGPNLSSGGAIESPHVAADRGATAWGSTQSSQREVLGRETDPLAEGGAPDPEIHLAKSKLAEYEAKRDLAKAGEPRGSDHPLDYGVPGLLDHASAPGASRSCRQRSDPKSALASSSRDRRVHGTPVPAVRGCGCARSGVRDPDSPAHLIGLVPCHRGR